jgi:chorismate mutase
MEKLPTLRKRIDEIDDQILKALSERVEVCKQIGEIKKQRGLPVRDQSRECEVYSKAKEKAAKFQLEPARIEALYREIVNMCSAVQK